MIAQDWLWAPHCAVAAFISFQLNSNPFIHCLCIYYYYCFKWCFCFALHCFCFCIKMLYSLSIVRARPWTMRNCGCYFCSRFTFYARLIRFDLFQFFWFLFSHKLTSLHFIHTFHLLQKINKNLNWHFDNDHFRSCFCFVTNCILFQCQTEFVSKFVP